MTDINMVLVGWGAMFYLLTTRVFVTDPSVGRSIILPAILVWFVVDSALLRWLVVFPAALVSLELRRAYFLFHHEHADLTALTSVVCALYTSTLGVFVHGILDRFRQPLGWVRNRTFTSWK